ncbi:MAG: hypothetical protein ACLVJ8_14850 [Ruthenibacterium lactatiformans]
MEQGTLFVKLESAREALPVQGRVVISQTVNGVRVLEIELVTDEDGLTQPVTLDAPDRSISLDPASTQQAWAAYDVEAYADGYSDILLEGVQVYSGVEAYAPISMLPIFLPGGFAHSRHGGHRFHLPQGPAGHPAHHHPRAAIRGGSASGPAPLSTCATQPLVLQSVFIPSTSPCIWASRRTAPPMRRSVSPITSKTSAAARSTPPGPKMPSVPTSTPRSLWR